MLQSRTLASAGGERGIGEDGAVEVVDARRDAKFRRRAVLTTHPCKRLANFHRHSFFDRRCTRWRAIRAAQNLRELPKPGATTRHELRTPLHTLLGLTRLLQTRLERHGQLTAQDGEFLEQIVVEAERLDSLIDDFS